MNITNEEIRSLLYFFEKSGWEELRLEAGGIKIAASKSQPLTAHVATAPVLTGTMPVTAGVSVTSAVQLAVPKPAPAPMQPAATAIILAPGQVYLRAPNLGVVWSRPKPGAPGYIEEGQLLEVGMTVCLIEVMKLFTQVDSKVRGRVVRCLVADGEMVEHDTPLFIIETV